MRCSECDGIVRQPSVGRLRDGRIVFGWCDACMDIAGAVRIELSDRVRLFGRGEKLAMPFGGTSWESEEVRGSKRIFGLTVTAAALAFWGLTMSLAGFASNDEPTPANPQGSQTGLFLVAAGGSLMGTALGLYLAARRARSRNAPVQRFEPGSRPEPRQSETAR